MQGISKTAWPAFNIVQVVSDFGLSSGGVATAARELAKGWQAIGMPSRTLTMDRSDLESSVEVEPIAPILARLQTRGGGVGMYIGRLLVVPVFTLAATVAARKYSLSVVLSHGDTLRGDVLVIHSLHAAMIEEKRTSGNWAWAVNPLNLMLAARDKFVITGLRFKKYVAVSPRVAAELIKFHNIPASRISVIPLGIDIHKFASNPVARSKVRQELGILRNGRMLIFVGHDFQNKGLRHVVEAMHHLPDDFSLLIVGSGNAKKYRALFKGDQSRLIFTGERSDTPQLYAAADCLVLPSHYETFSMVCMEAMASGLPVLATRVGGIEDYLLDGINGYFIKRDAVDIADKVIQLFSGPAHLRQFGLEAVETAKKYTWESVALKYSDLLHEVWQEKMSIANLAFAPVPQT